MKTRRDYGRIRDKIFELRKQGKSCDTIDRMLRLSRGTVSRRLRNRHGVHDGREYNKGKNTKVTPALKEQVRAILETNPPSLAVVRQKLYEDSVLSLSKPTLRKIALSLGFKYGAARKVPKLTDAGKAKRMAFCRAHTDTDFKSWIFSDETYISLYEGTKMLWYRPSKRPEVKVSGWGPKVMSTVNNLFNSIPSRISEVIRVNGNAIHV